MREMNSHHASAFDWDLYGDHHETGTKATNMEMLVE
jgi:hypothetical protein